MKTASVTFVCGYLVRVAEENTTCDNCLDKLTTVSNCSPLNVLIKSQDCGGLRYPKPSFVSLVLLLVDFCTSAIPFLPNKNVRTLLQFYCKTRFTNELKCSKCDNEKLCLILLTKLLNPLLDNVARKLTEKHLRTKWLNSKPLNRKILKL